MKNILDLVLRGVIAGALLQISYSIEDGIFSWDRYFSSGLLIIMGLMILIFIGFYYIDSWRKKRA